jgi:hypothetical protein
LVERDESTIVKAVENQRKATAKRNEKPTVSTTGLRGVRRRKRRGRRGREEEDRHES